MFKYCNFKDIIYGAFLEDTWKEWTKIFLELTEDFDISKIDNFHFDYYHQRVTYITMGDYEIYVGKKYWTVLQPGDLTSYKGDSNHKYSLLSKGRNRLKEIMKEIDGKVNEAINEWQESNNNEFYIKVKEVAYVTDTKKFKVLR